MRILLIGASGQLGSALSAVFSKEHAVIEAVHHRALGRQRTIDLADRVSTEAALLESKPDLILIAGAFCNVDLSETEPETCRRVNVGGPRQIGEYARDHGARVVYYSTDHVFEGREESYRESDMIKPASVYARSKAEGEEALREVLPDRHLILRTAWLYGPDHARRNFALRLVSRMSAGERVRVPSDQWGSPTCTEDLALATLHLVRRGLAGTFHATGPEFVDRASLARLICEEFSLDESRIVPTPTEELGQVALRPLKVRLECEKLRATGAPPFRSVKAGIHSLHVWHETVWHDEGTVPPVAT